MCSIMKPSGIGGQAVIEGVMMKNKDQYATAVRKPNNEIVIEKSTYVSIAEKYKFFKLPIFRGMLAFAESMIIGTRTLTFSTSFYEEEEEIKPSKLENAFSKVFKGKAESVAMGLTFLISILLAVGIFIILPRFTASLLTKQIESEVVLTIIEGCIRILIFIAYVVAIAQVKDIKRMFMYHGAEHKTINCLENGFELTVENVKWQSKQHKRCGTSFMFIVMFVSIIFFIFIRVDQEWLRYLIRILLIPIIAGVSYEFIRFAGKSNSKVVTILSQPGMWMQGLTTKEPNDEMIEVAIQSVEAVFNWKEFLEQSDRKSLKNRNSDKSNKNQKNNSDNNSNKKDAKRNNSSDNNSNNSKNSTSNQNGNSSNNKSNNNGNSKKQANTMNSQMKQKLDVEIKEEINNEEKNIKQHINPVNKKQTSKDYKKALGETAATVEKSGKVKPKAMFGEDEDDEILRALDRFLINKEETIDKE